MLARVAHPQLEVVLESAVEGRWRLRHLPAILSMHLLAAQLALKAQGR